MRPQQAWDELSMPMRQYVPAFQCQELFGYCILSHTRHGPRNDQARHPMGMQSQDGLASCMGWLQSSEAVHR